LKSFLPSEGSVSSCVWRATAVCLSVISVDMRDEHRPKQDLIHEITGLRKQVVDLKEEMTARRRVEDALRSADALLRSLTDNAPVGLGLFRQDGTLLAANRPFARMLGYQSPAELQALSSVLGVFASADERLRALDSARTAKPVRDVLFRRKDGCRRTHAIMTGEPTEGQTITLALFEPALSPFPDQPRVT
jgi:PAS domain S-box-containing protein